MSYTAGMQQTAVQQAMQSALRHQQAGRLAQAEQLYRRVLAAQPRNPDALHLLGLIAAQCGRLDIAAELIGQAVATRPGIWGYHHHLGLIFLDLGKLDQAHEHLQQAAALNPQSAAAGAGLARLHEAEGNAPAAIAALRQAVKLDPDSAENWCNLGRLLQSTGQTFDAAGACRRAIILDPKLAEAHNNLAVALIEQGQLDEAITAGQVAIQLQPRLAQAHNTLGNALWLQRRFEESIIACGEATRLMPGFAVAHANLGAALADSRQLDAATVACRRAIELDPNLPGPLNTLGNVLWKQGNLIDAEKSCRAALRVAADFAGAHSNLAAILMARGNYDEALLACHRAMQLQPSLAQPCDIQGQILLYQGQAQAAIAPLQRAVELNPLDPQIHSNLVFTCCYLPAEAEDRTLEEARAWADRHARGRDSRTGAHPSTGRLKIGYVSADFRNHPVARFLWPLLANHDLRQFEIHCFSSVLCSDATTDRLRTKADRWHDVAAVTDAALSDLIQREQIDILVDLGGHSARNRLLTFARKPAKIQVAWLGYPATTGMAAIDYRISDAYADPPGITQQQFTERLIRLPKTAWCYQPQVETPAPTGREESMPITFGCFNNFAKVNEPMLRLWIEIMHRVPGSRLCLKAASLASPSLVANTRRLLESTGICGDRIELRGWSESPISHLSAYGQIDIALDTFPYHGTTTTCEALWMGVPVITLAGTTHRSRVGVSLLSNAGVAELVAYSRQEYADIAVALARDRARLALLRGSLRDRLLGSALMDAVQFTKDMESTLQWIFRSS